MNDVFSLISAYCVANSNSCARFEVRGFQVLAVCVPVGDFKIFGSHDYTDKKSRKILTVSNCDVEGPI